MCGYVGDDTALARGEEQPVKQDDHVRGACQAGGPGGPRSPSSPKGRYRPGCGPRRARGPVVDGEHAGLTHRARIVADRPPQRVNARVGMSFV
jgi:hypothetical protein